MNCEVREFMSSDLESLNELLETTFNVKKTNKKSCNDNLELIAFFDNKVIGYLVFSKLYDSVKDTYYGQINYVCVRDEYRNKGVATKLLDEVFQFSKKENISYIELTSNKKRIEANLLYKNKGFVIRDTNVFRKEIL